MQETLVYIVRDTSKILNVYSTKALAVESWKLSYSKLFVPTFQFDCLTSGSRMIVLSATGNQIGTIECWPVFSTVEHL